MNFVLRTAHAEKKKRGSHNPDVHTIIIIITSNKNFILKYFRCRDGKRTETRIGMEGICITHSCIPPL